MQGLITQVLEEVYMIAQVFQINLRHIQLPFSEMSGECNEGCIFLQIFIKNPYRRLLTRSQPEIVPLGARERKSNDCLRVCTVPGPEQS